MKPASRSFWFVLSTVFLCALLGGVYGKRVEAAAAMGDDSDVKKSLEAFGKIYSLVELNYADPVNPDRTIFGTDTHYETPTGLGAIPNMLRTLDPHSSFLDPSTYARLREDQEGKYYGVGMGIRSFPGKMGKLQTFVDAPIPGSPALRAGLRPGDLIVKVDGKPTEGLTTAQVARMLKGPKGTVVHITVSREGYDEPLQFTIVRDEIARRSVDETFLIRPGVAYIHIATFENEKTAEQLNEALRQLDEKTLQGLILDLRGNPGGLLQEAVQVSDRFLEKHQLIVYHSGRNSAEKRYFAQHGDRGNEYPMVVLINRMTASAAEIVTGALQDHDRALVMGEPSFGKGLVQTVYPLSEQAGLALTTARYYTPSGRLIQREYTNVSLHDYYNRSEDAPAPHTEVRLTDGGREVYGGGGITPDIKVADPKLTRTQEALARRDPFYHDVFFNFAKHYLGIHKTIPRDFQVTQDALDEFKGYLAKEKMQISDQAFKDSLGFIKTWVRYQLVLMVYGEDEAHRLGVANDPLVDKAIENLPRAKDLLARAKRYIASKNTK